MFSNKSVDRESITHVKDDKILPGNLHFTKIFNLFLSNIVKEMNISLGLELLEPPALKITQKRDLKITLVWLLY